jgi:hypothetical protein
MKREFVGGWHFPFYAYYARNVKYTQTGAKVFTGDWFKITYNEYIQKRIGVDY